MSARSQAQRGYLAAHFGPAWMRKHHFDNKGKLPAHAAKGSARKEALKRMRKKGRKA